MMLIDGTLCAILSLTVRSRDYVHRWHVAHIRERCEGAMETNRVRTILLIVDMLRTIVHVVKVRLYAQRSCSSAVRQTTACARLRRLPVCMFINSCDGVYRSLPYTDDASSARSRFEMSHGLFPASVLAFFVLLSAAPRHSRSYLFQVSSRLDECSHVC